jgi:ABC-type multidrug transport system fused ATPase/permease subunit
LIAGTAADRRDSRRLNEALWLVLRRYGRQITRHPWIALPALVLPGIGDVLVFYAPPLVVAQLLGAVARDQALTMGMLVPYVLTFTALWFAGEVVWRGAEALIARAEIRGIESLYVEAMDELLAKDLAFFHDNFAGSLTKRTLGYARRFEDVFDVLAFQVIAKILPLGFVTVVLWRYSPLLILVLLGMLSITVALVVPRIRRRRLLVDEREAASNVLAGHVADSIANAEPVRAFARERDRQEDAPVVGLPELPREHDHRADVRSDEYARPDRRASHQSRHRVESGDRLPHVQLLRDGHTGDVGVQPGLSQSRGRADRRRAVRRSAVGSAVGPGCRIARSVRAARPQRRGA